MKVHSSIIIRKQPKNEKTQTTGNWWMDKKNVYIHTTDCYLAIKRHDTLIYATTGWTLKTSCIILPIQPGLQNEHTWSRVFLLTLDLKQEAKLPQPMCRSISILITEFWGYLLCSIIVAIIVNQYCNQFSHCILKRFYKWKWLSSSRLTPWIKSFINLRERSIYLKYLMFVPLSS